MSGDRQTFKKLFVDTDDGQVLEVHVFGTSSDDWQKLLDFLASAYRCTYNEDDVLLEAIPRYETIVERRNIATQLLRVYLSGGASINSHFFETESIEFDLLPREIEDPEQADLVIAFMQALSRLLAKDVFLNEENNSVEEWLKEEALASIDATTGTLNVF